MSDDGPDDDSVTQLAVVQPGEPMDELAVAELYRNAIAGDDISTAIDMSHRLWDKRTDVAVACLRIGDLKAAGIAALASIEVLPELLATIDQAVNADDLDPTEKDQLTAVARTVGEILAGWQFVGYLWTGLGQMMSGAFDEAKSSFAESREVIEKDDAEKDSDLELASLCRAYESACDGYSQMRRFNFGEAAKQLMRARAVLGEVNDLEVAPSPEVPSDMVSQSIDLDTARLEFESAYHLMVYQDRANDDPPEALSHISEAIRLQEESQKRLSQSDVTNLTPWVLTVKTAVLHQFRAQQAILAGQVHREKREWEEAKLAYQQARAQYQKASMAWLTSGLPQGQALQDVLYNLMSGVSLMQRQCNQEEQLVRRVQSLERDVDEIMEMISKSIGARVEVTTRNELKAALNQQVQITDRNVRTALEEFLAKLPATGLDEATKSDLERSTREVLASPDPQTLLERVASWGKQVAGALKPWGDAASQLLPYIKIAAAASGHPIPI